MRRFVLGTAGHVDHGKTTLVRALTGRDTDRLPEEKRRGITIELGFAPWDLGGGITASVVDVPGHRRLVHAMIAGASGIELVMLVVAADEGVMPQTREHVRVCELLGVTRAVIVVTKVDLVDGALARVAEEEARALLGGRWAADAVHVSAVTGEGIEALGRAVRGALEGAAPRPAAARARMSVDRVLSVRGAGTVVTGTLVAGRIATGAPLFVVGERGVRATHARSLQVHDAPVDAGEGPTRLAVNLAGLAQDEVHRGDVLTDDASLRTTEVVDVAVLEDARVARGAAAVLHVGTARAPVRVLRVEGGVARLGLASPIAIAGGDRYVLRGSDVEGPTGAVIAGGVVLDAAPSRVRSRARWKSVIDAIAAGDAEGAARGLVDERAPRPLERATLEGRYAVDGGAIARAADRAADRGELVRLGDRAWIGEPALRALVARACALVADHAKASPLERGMPIETLREKLARKAGRDAAERAIQLGARAAADVGAIVIDGDVARVGSRVVDEATARRLTRARTALTQASTHGLTAFAAGEAAQASPADVRALMARLERDGEAVRAGDLWFSRTLVDDMRARAVDHLGRARQMSVGDFKAISGLPRKQAILLLEHFDRLGVTRREGDARVLV